jgi:hypothetical protein
VNAEVAEVGSRAYGRIDFTPGAPGRLIKEPHAAVADKDGQVTGDVADVAEFPNALLSTRAFTGFGSHVPLEDNPFGFHLGEVLLFYRQVKQGLDDFLERHGNTSPLP